MTRLAIVELQPEKLHFSAGHFTIFSDTQREDLHGHNYHINAAFFVTLPDTGLAFDYRLYRDKIFYICQQLDRRFLLPQFSPYLSLKETEKNWLVTFNAEEMVFLKRDVVILPISNVTIEELAHWFLKELTQNPTAIQKDAIHGIRLKVFNGPGQAGVAQWGETYG